MTSAGRTRTDGEPAQDPLALPTGGGAGGADLSFVWRWLLLGGAAGAWAGFLVGGVGGRVAMFVLRLTSSDAVRGIESDDGFTIGRISGATVFLLAITTVLGMVVGVVCVLARSQLPGRSGAVLIILAGGTLGAAALIKPDGVDFTRLAPRPLACAMFTVIPTAASALTLWFAARWRRWWWRNPRRTVLAAAPWIATVPAFFVSMPVVVGSLVLGGTALRIGFVRRALTNRAGRTVATVLAVAVIGFASAGLVSDLAAIL